MTSIRDQVIVMAKYKADAEKLLPDLGGKGNTSAVWLSEKRMRFVLNFPGKSGPKSIEYVTPSVRLFTAYGSVHVVI
ncbi:hypothetical protein KYX90_13675, partial [Enterococcus lactis]|nr:hypothetical protein [Enterococcus lactis]